MKFFKFIFVFCVCISFTNCSSTNEELTPVFTLSNENIKGTYEINSLTFKEVETVTSNSGNSTIILTTIEGAADSFNDVSLELNANGSYTASGKYRSVFTETPNGDSPITDNDIIIFDASGTFQVDITNKTITFNEQSGDFVNGTFTISAFTETTLSIDKEDTKVDGNTTITVNDAITFVKK